MADLFECPVCRKPFVALDEELIAQRNGYCATCTGREWLKRFGLPPDFLDGLPGFQY